MLFYRALIRLSLIGIVMFVLIDPLMARFTTEAQTYQEMFDKADLVVIARALETKDTSERSKLLHDVDVIGVETEFVTRVTLKGPKEIRKFVLHHYREEPDDASTANGPALIRIPPGPRHPDFLMFLKKEKNGRYAPVTGQTDPMLFSVLELKSAVISEGPEE